MNVLITGGTGFIGSRLSLKCLELGHSVKVLGLENTPAESYNKKIIEEKGAKVVPVSIMDREALFEHLKGIDVVYHLAAAQHEMNVPDQHFWDVNVTGTRNVLESSVSVGVKRFVHGSTIGVYGIVDGLIDEETPCNPENIYGVTKLEGEKLALSFNEKIPVVVIRIPEVYGPGDRRLLKLFKAIKKNTFFMIGSGKNLHHLIYVDDLIEAFLLASNTEEGVGQVFLLAGEEPISSNDMASTIAKELGAKGALFRVPFLPLWILAAILEFIFRPVGIQPPLHRRRMDFFKKSFELSWKKASLKLKYQPKVSLEEGIARTFEWYTSTGLLQTVYPAGKQRTEKNLNVEIGHSEEASLMPSKFNLKACIEPFDSFWEAPDDIQKGYSSFGTFYRHNYLRYFPSDMHSKILVISCGPGYMVNLLNQRGYSNVLGIDSMEVKIGPGKARNLNCEAARAFDFLEDNQEHYEVIFCEQEINHLTKEEILLFIGLCHRKLNDNGLLIVHSLNGANPIVGSENLALNYDHYNIFTEKSLEQILVYSGFKNIRVFPLKLYVFYHNPFNYVGIFIETVLNQLFKYSFKFYGKSNNLFSKKIAAVSTKS